MKAQASPACLDTHPLLPQFTLHQRDPHSQLSRDAADPSSCHHPGPQHPWPSPPLPTQERCLWWLGGQDALSSCALTMSWHQCTNLEGLFCQISAMGRSFRGRTTGHCPESYSKAPHLAFRKCFCRPEHQTPEARSATGSLTCPSLDLTGISVDPNAFMLFFFFFLKLNL